MLSLAPPVSRRAAIAQLPEVTPARGTRRGRVALMQGCVNRVFFGDVNAATVRVLSAEGWEVHAPRLPRCCGALQLHAGRRARGARAREGDDRRLRGLRGRRGQRRRLRLGDEGLRAPAVRRPGVGRARRTPSPPASRTSPSCSPTSSRRRRAIRSRCGSPTTTPAISRTRRASARSRARCCAAIPELELLEPADWELCCGSAGIYNLVEPEAAAELGARKARNLVATGADVVAAGNPGCALQIAAHLDGRELPDLPPDDPAGPLDQRNPPMKLEVDADRRAAADPRPARPSTSSASCTRASAVAAASCSPRGTRAPPSCEDGATLDFLDRDARDPRGRLAGRRAAAATTSTAASRSPARPTASSSSTR